MTVGQPETNLNTWGLRYVKKKKGDAMDLTGDAPTKSPQFGGGSELDLATANPSGRQNDSSGDTTGRYAASGKKIGEQSHIHQQGQKDDIAGQKRQTFTTSGTSRGEGATQGADTTPSGQGGAGQALTRGTRKNPPRESAGLEGSKQTHTGSKGFDWARNPQTSRNYHKIKPAKQGEGSSAKPSKYIQRAALDLAIIKCKLLKMNNIQKKDIIEENKPTRPQFRKEDDEVTQDEKTEASKQNIARQRESSKQDSDEKLGQHNFYKSEDVVDKAIELINMAYDEMNKAHELGEEDKQSDFQWHKADSSDLLRTDKPERTAEGKRSNKPHNYGEGDAERVGRADNIENRPSNEYNSDRKIKGEITDEMKSDGFKKLKPTYEGDTKQAKKDAPSTTSSEGSANFVYSDVAEAKKNEDWFENKPSKKDQKKLGKKYTDWYKEEITDQQ